MTVLILIQQAQFLHKIHSNTLPLEYMILDDNEKLWIKKPFYNQTFIVMVMTWYISWEFTLKVILITA